MSSLLRRTLLGLSCTALSFALLATPATAVENFSKAKRILPQIYHQLDQEFGHTQTIYCGCELIYKKSGSSYKWTPDLESCGYEPRKNANRAKRIEVEHVMAAWEFGHQMKCWREGGRDECGKDSTFDRMEGDLHNLYPAVGEVNGDRSNYQFTDWNGKATQYGKCQMVVDFAEDRVQPPKPSRGMIARAYLYMSEQYDIRLSPAQRRLYEAWNRQHPADALECRRNELITKEQGNDNPFVTASCKLSPQQAAGRNSNTSSQVSSSFASGERGTYKLVLQ